MNETVITEITIIPLKPREGLVALASCIIDGKLYTGSIGIYTKLRGGYRITFPTKKIGEKSINIYHPINKEVGDAIEKAIVEHYEKLVSKEGNIYDEDLHTK